MTLIFTPSILHSHDDPDWYSPATYVDAAREVMGGIDLDPASHADANKWIQAAKYYTKEDDGLKQVWKGRLFINPPGGQVATFWKKLMSSVGVEQFVWMGFSLEQLQTLQNSMNTSPLDFPFCIPRKRIPFIENTAKRAARVAKCIKDGKTFHEKTSPTHGNYIVYGGTNTSQFAHIFGRFGQVRL